MELKNRVANHPGRIVLQDIQTGERKTYDVILADEATEQGTPINKETLETLKEEILDQTKTMVQQNDAFTLSGTTLIIKI